MAEVRLRKTPGRNLAPAHATTMTMIRKFRTDKRRCVPCTLQLILRASHCTGFACFKFEFSSCSSPSASRCSLIIAWEIGGGAGFFVADACSEEVCCDGSGADCCWARADITRNSKTIASRAIADTGRGKPCLTAGLFTGHLNSPRARAGIALRSTGQVRAPAPTRTEPRDTFTGHLPGWARAWDAGRCARFPRPGEPLRIAMTPWLAA